MTLRRLLPLFAAVPFAACSPQVTSKAPVAAAGRASASLGEAPLPRSPDIHREVMGWLVLSDGERVMRELAPPDARETKSGALEAQLFAEVGLDPVLADMIDLRRPAGVALLNPSLLASGNVRPFVAMLPVTSRGAIETALTKRGATLEETPWGFAVPTAAGKIYVGFAAGYALIAWRADLLDGARKLLAPRLAAHADAPVVVHVDLENVHASFGSQMDALLNNVVRVAESNGATPTVDPQLVFALRGLHRLMGYVDSVSAVELLADVDSGGLTFTARLDGKHEGAWADYVKQQHPGPAWGTEFLPRDSVMVYTTRSSPRGRADDVDAALAFFEGATSKASKPAVAQLARWRRALEKAASSTEGELAYAVWPGQKGGLGLGGAYRTSDPPTARAAMREVYGELASALGGLVVRSLLLDPARFSPRAIVQQRATTLGGQAVDLVEVSFRWPSGAESEKRAFESLFGPKLTLATAFVGDRALFAVGADWSARLATMIGAANGETAASVGDEPSFAEALSYHDQSRVSMSYLDSGRMARFAAGLVAQVNELDEGQRATMSAMLAQVGSGAIVSTTNASGARFELTTHVPHTAILGAAHLHGALWRVALSPMVNPPTVPPLPLPPPHVTPSLTPAGEPAL